MNPDEIEQFLISGQIRTQKPQEHYEYIEKIN